MVTNQTVQVPASMNYSEWKKEFVRNEPKISHSRQAKKQNIGRMSERERENEYGVPYGEKYITADGEYINSSEYRSKFANITENEKVNNIICDHAKKAVLDNSGTLRESMYLVDAESGKLIAAIDKEKDKIKEGVSYTDEFKQKLEKAKKAKRKIIAIHNHPQGYPPSIDDFKKAYDNNYYISIAAGANGQVYAFKNNSIPISEMDCKEIHAQIAYGVAGEATDPDRAYREVYKMIGLEYNIKNKFYGGIGMFIEEKPPGVGEWDPSPIVKFSSQEEFEQGKAETQKRFDKVVEKFRLLKMQQERK